MDGFIVTGGLIVSARVLTLFPSSNLLVVLRNNTSGKLAPVIKKQGRLMMQDIGVYDAWGV